MNFRVYEFETDKDVTNKKEWFIDTDGDLRFLTNDVDDPLQMTDGQYYYKLEIEVF